MFFLLLPHTRIAEIREHAQPMLCGISQPKNSKEGGEERWIEPRVGGGGPKADHCNMRNSWVEVGARVCLQEGGGAGGGGWGGRQRSHFKVDFDVVQAHESECVRE